MLRWTILKLPTCFLPAHREVGSLEDSLSTKAYSSGQDPRSFLCEQKNWKILPPVSQESVFPSHLPIPYLYCGILQNLSGYLLLNKGQVPPIGNSCVVPAILPRCSVWAGRLSAARLQSDWISGFQSRYLQSTGERRQQSRAC